MTDGLEHRLDALEKRIRENNEDFEFILRMLVEDYLEMAPHREAGLVTRLEALSKRYEEIGRPDRATAVEIWLTVVKDGAP